MTKSIVSRRLLPPMLLVALGIVVPAIAHAGRPAPAVLWGCR
jgi:hypothetical protein